MNSETIEKVLKGLQCCVNLYESEDNNCDQCPYNDDLEFNETCRSMRPILKEAYDVIVALTNSRKEA